MASNNVVTIPSPVNNKVIAITGGASGIGRATAHKLVARGAIVSLADMQSDALETTAASLKKQTPNAQVLTATVDVRKGEQVDQWITATVAKFGRLDGALNLAGTIGKRMGAAKITEVLDEDWQFVVDVNLNGVFNCLRAQLKVLSDNGSIVNASSIAGRKGGYGSAAYSAAKAGVMRLSETAAIEEGRRGVRVNSINPGWVETPMTAQVQRETNARDMTKSRVPLGRVAEPEDVSNLLIFLLGDESGYISGASYVIDGGLVNT